MDLKEAGTEGKIFNFIQNFLKPRNVVHPKFFRLKKIVAWLPNENRYQVSLHMEDQQISYRHPDVRTVKRKLRGSIDIVENVAQNNGFKFSTTKTSMLYFTKLSSPRPIELGLGNIRLQKSEKNKIP